MKIKTAINSLLEARQPDVDLKDVDYADVEKALQEHVEEDEVRDLIRILMIGYYPKELLKQKSAAVAIAEMGKRWRQSIVDHPGHFMDLLGHRLPLPNRGRGEYTVEDLAGGLAELFSNHNLGITRYKRKPVNQMNLVVALSWIVAIALPDWEVDQWMVIELLTDALGNLARTVNSQYSYASVYAVLAEVCSALAADDLTSQHLQNAISWNEMAYVSFANLPKVMQNTWLVKPKPRILE